MAISRAKKYVLCGILGLILGIVIIVPIVLGSVLRGTAERRLHEATNGPVKLGGFKVHFLPPGATFSELEIGSRDPAAANKPLLKIDSVSVSVPFGTIFGGVPHITSLSISGLVLNPVVDGKGRSSFSTFLRGMTPRKAELQIDSLVLRKIHIATFIDRHLTHSTATAGEADGTLDVDEVSASNLILPALGEQLGRQVWIKAEIDNVVCTAPTTDTAAPTEGAVPDGIRVARISVELAQAASASGPVTIKQIVLEQPSCATVYSTRGRLPAAQRALDAVKYGMGTMDPDDNRDENSTATSQGTGILIERLAIRNGRIETRGPDAAGKPAFWRLKDLNVNGERLAYDPAVNASVPGYLEINSESESSGGPGRLRVGATNITGGFPKSSFDIHYKVDGIAATAFSAASQDAGGPGVQSGQIAMLFDGSCRNGNLNVDGSLTLGTNFEVDSAMANMIAQIERGSPIEPIRVRGTLEHPDLTWPRALAGVIGNAIEKISLNTPIGLLNTGGTMMEAVGSQGIRESGKATKDAINTLKKATGFFGGE